MAVENFASVVRRLAQEQGVSVNQIGFLAYDPDVRGTNPDTFKSVMAGRRKPTMVLMEAVAGVLEVDPGVFYEWLLERARETLDAASKDGGAATAEELRAATDALTRALLEAGAATSPSSASKPATARGKGRKRRDPGGAGG